MTQADHLFGPAPGHDRALRDQAQLWVARLAGGEISEAEIDQLEGWLAADPAHARSFSRERALWQDLKAAMTETAPADAMPQPAPAQPSRREMPPRRALLSRRPLLSRRRLLRLAPMAVAASIAAMVAPSVMLDLRADHRTAAGEVRRLALPDGTTAMLDSNSAIAVDFSGDQRQVRLLAGRAWFDVRHETRPFTVAAMGGVTRDIGTGFEVDRADDAVEIGVTEGSVQVRAPDGSQSAPLHQGSRIRYSRSGLVPLAPLSASQLAAWRNGEILLEHRRIDSAIAEIARYRRAPVWVLGDFGQAAPVSGLFLIERPDEAINTIARMRGLRITSLPGGALIIRPAATE